MTLWTPTNKPDNLFSVHGRRWRRDRRFTIEARIRRHSFKNHYLEMIKNERPGDFLMNLPALALWEVLRFGFAVLRDRDMLPGYRDAWRLTPRAFRKRAILQKARHGAATTSPKTLSSFRPASPRIADRE